jgi:hypothetical protein
MLTGNKKKNNCIPNPKANKKRANAKNLVPLLIYPK